jgi:AraC-like DNA-binding protein|tara:strand:+ start:45507 stop:46544 length:1038 start_codon:yes stop_codon:yes gene_type:complete
MFKVDFLTLLAIFGTLQGVLFALLFWFKNKEVYNKIFALLLLAASIRIAKNIVVHLSELNPELFWSNHIAQTFIYIGIAHQFAIGPLFLLYFHSRGNPHFKFRWIYLVHFLPYCALVICSHFLQWSFWEDGGLFLSYISILGYYLATLRYYSRNEKLFAAGLMVWFKSILIISAILLIVYSPALFKYVGYIGGAALYGLGLLTAGYILILHKNSKSIFNSKYRLSLIKESTTREIIDKLEAVMGMEKLYLDSELTLTCLAKKIDVSSHQLSQIINKEFRKSYNEYVNLFRLNEATVRLENPKNNHLKIAAIAFDCGFNSQPTFNTLFKKQYQVTPSQYRKKFQHS